MRCLLRLGAFAIPLAFLAALTFGPTIAAPFLFDDFEGIVRNPNVRALAPSAGEAMDWRAALTAPGGTGASGRPLVALSLAVDYARGGLSPEVFRTTNVAVLFLAALTLALLCFHAARERTSVEGLPIAIPLAAFFAAAIWIVHPLHGSAVHQIIYRGELMMTLAFFATLLFAQLGFASVKGSSGTKLWLSLSVVSCALGMLSKENMAAAPIICLLWDRSRDARYGLLERLRARPLYYTSLAGTWLILAIAWSSGDRGEAVGVGARGISSIDYLATQASVVASYGALTFFPFDLAFDYSDWPIATRLFENALAGALVLSILVLCVFATFRRSLIGLAGLASFLVLAPTSTVFPIAVSIAAEHRVTLPLAAVAAALSFGLIVRCAREGKPAQLFGIGASIFIVLALSLGARNRNVLFTEPRALWAKAVEERPRNILARSHLVEELRRDGKDVDALKEIAASLAVDAKQPQLVWNQGLILAGLERQVESDSALREALRQDESLAPKQMHEAMRAWSESRIADALHQLRICLNLKPELAGRARLGSISLQAARAFAVAAEESFFDPALALKITEQLPQEDLRVLEARATALAALGRFEEASQTLNRALPIAHSNRNQRATERLKRQAALYAEGRMERRPVVPEGGRL